MTKQQIQRDDNKSNATWQQIKAFGVAVVKPQQQVTQQNTETVFQVMP